MKLSPADNAARTQLNLPRRTSTKVELPHIAVCVTAPALCAACYFDAPIWLQLLILVTLICAVVLSIVGSRRKRFRPSKLQRIDSMSGVEFELHLASYFREQGYNVEVTVTTGDYGADLILRKGRQTVVVQAKRWSRNVGVSSVQEVIAAKQFYKATDALLVTNSELTRNAIKLAAGTNVTVWNRNCLIEKLESNYRQDAWTKFLARR